MSVMNIEDRHREKSKIVDSHFHLLEMAEKGIDTESFLSGFGDCFTAGIDIGIMPSDLEKRLQRFVYPKKCFKSSGLYPAAVEDTALEKEKHLLERQAENRQIDAIGEAGLDWHWNYGSHSEQMDLFRWQLELADNTGLPLIVHNRLADREIADLISGYAGTTKLIFHCYSSDNDFLQKMLRYDCYFSYSGNVTYKKSGNIREAMKNTPQDRLLFETDSPYLAPVPKRGEINRPENVRFVYEFASDFLGINLSELILRVEKNFNGLFTF
ncbi:MAG: TatD family hydrolase [Spirochaetales bacterium]|nr:TatD family hydrolase [Spirochaetales bacterium]